MEVAPSARSTNFKQFLVQVEDPLALELEVLRISLCKLTEYETGRIWSSQQLHLPNITANNFSKLKEYFTADRILSFKSN